VRALNHKLLRDLWTLRGQALAIAAVIVSGVTTLVMFLSTLDSLEATQARYYREYRFADLFATLERAPERLRHRIARLPGVERVQSRVVAAVNLEVAGFDEPVSGRLISLPDDGRARLNALYIVRGRTIIDGRAEEVVVSESFARAHNFNPGDRLHAIINGRRQPLTIVGTAQSPEYIYQFPPGAFFPDHKRYGILWMARTPLAAAQDMEGAFNDLTLRLADDASEAQLIDRLDLMLHRYGGTGAYGRADQLSHRFLTEELHGLAVSARIFPAIFLGVAAFLLHVVLNRLIGTQREQIAILKAFGYGRGAIAGHYTLLVLAIVAIGAVAGSLLGIYWGRGLSRLYAELYQFPFLDYRVRPAVLAVPLLVTAAAALAGTLSAVRRAAALPPAEAMRPESPVTYHATLVERLGLQRWFAQPTRMILRHLERRPVKSLLSVVGVALACGIMMVGSFQEDAVRYMVGVQYGLSQRDDATVLFTDPTSRRAVHELNRLPGVRHAEGFRSVPVRLRYGHRSYRTAVEGTEPDGVLARPLDQRLHPLPLPPAGMVLTDYLAAELGVGVGDTVTVEVLEGARPVRQVTVTAFSHQYLGVSALMPIAALNRLLGEGNALSGAYLALAPGADRAVYNRLREMPRVASVILREAAVKSFYDTIAETILFFSFIANLLGASIAFGVVYNTARIALSERGRELASLRVLGFTRGEISYILLGELALITLLAIPLGFLFGRGLCALLAAAFENDLYRIALVLEPPTYAGAALVVLLSALLSGAVVWRQLGRLDLVAVLKTRE